MSSLHYALRHLHLQRPKQYHKALHPQLLIAISHSQLLIIAIIKVVGALTTGIPLRHPFLGDHFIQAHPLRKVNLARHPHHRYTKHHCKITEVGPFEAPLLGCDEPIEEVGAYDVFFHDWYNFPDHSGRIGTNKHWSADFGRGYCSRRVDKKNY